MRRILILLALASAPVLAQPGQPAPPLASRSMQDSHLKTQLPAGLQGIGIDQKLDQQLPLHLMFKDEFGREVALSTFFSSKKPVVLALVYYRCPMLCTQILSGLESSLKAVSTHSSCAALASWPAQASKPNRSPRTYFIAQSSARAHHSAAGGS